MAHLHVTLPCARCGHRNRVEILPFCDQQNAQGDSDVTCEGCGRTGRLHIQTEADPVGGGTEPGMPPRGRYILGWDCALCRRFGNLIVLDAHHEPGEFTSPCLLCGALHKVRLEVRVDYPPDPTVTCPCCGYVTLHQPRAWEICGICFWEDEETLGDPDWVTGANRLSLRQAQRNVARFGAGAVRRLHEPGAAPRQRLVTRRGYLDTGPLQGRFGWFLSVRLPYSTHARVRLATFVR